MQLNKILFRARLAYILKSYRHQRSLGQTVLSKQLGVSQGYLARVEQGKVMPSMYFWFSTCHHLDMPFHFILWEEERIRCYIRDEL